MDKCVADLLICVASLKAYLLACKVGIKEEGLNTESLIACKLWLSWLLRDGNRECGCHAEKLLLQYRIEW